MVNAWESHLFLVSVEENVVGFRVNSFMDDTMSVMGKDDFTSALAEAYLPPDSPMMDILKKESRFVIGPVSQHTLDTIPIKFWLGGNEYVQVWPVPAQPNGKAKKGKSPPLVQSIDQFGDLVHLILQYIGRKRAAAVPVNAPPMYQRA